MPPPMISIITPCLNRAEFVREAVQSVLDQNYTSVEHIIIDAGSTDGTLDFLREYSHLRVVSEPDEGMYDALNKGIRMAQGEIIGLLNTDDLYAPGCFEEVIRVFGENPTALAVCGGTVTFKDRNGVREKVRHAPAIAPDELWYRLIQGHPATNAWFFKREVFEMAGYFDHRYRYAADRYFLIRIALDNDIRPVPVHRELYYYRQHSGSATVTMLDSRDPEHGLLRIRILWEDITALESFLIRNTLPADVRRRMRREHGERCYRLVATALYHHRSTEAYNAAMHGFKVSFFWPLIFIQMATRRLRKEIANHE